MAPIPTTKHSRTVLSAKNPRGIYAPPSPSALTSTASTNKPSPADLHTGPSTSLKRKRVADDFAFGEDGDFKVNKKDKRTVRHNALLAKVKDSGVRKGKVLKRRRPSKKLKTDLGGLADALPDAEETGAAHSEDEGEDGWEGIEDEDGDEAMAGVEGLRKAKRRRRAASSEGKMVMKSLRHRPGAMKRKRKMEVTEMERFQKNLAQMVGSQQTQQQAQGQGADRKSGGGDANAGSAQADRWAALRSFIGGTMEKSDAFGKK